MCCCLTIIFSGELFAQNKSAADSLKIKYPFSDSRNLNLRPKSSISLPNPSNIQRSVDFDPITKRYIIQDKIGDKLFRAPQYLTIDEYQKYENDLVKRNYWKQLSDAPISKSREPGFIPAVTINNKSFERIFGGSIIDIRPQGTAELTLAGRINKNENPLFNERQRKQGNFDFDQRIQMNVVGNIGDKLRITTNYNTEASFDFENQMKLDYTGRPDEIIQKIEAGNVSLPLNSTLITGSQALFGLKTQLQFGRLNVTSIFSQQKSQPREITISNGSQQNTFRITGDNYEANKHYFLAHYFRNNYNEALKNIPLITSNITITKAEVWVTNRSNSTVDSRDVLAFIDLGEYEQENLYNKTYFQGGGSRLPAGFSGDPGFPQQSNSLLQSIPSAARLTNDNSINTYFATGTDNYSKLTYARKLTDREYTLHPRLGYISLNSALNADEVLAVAFRYNVNGVEYQVGEFATDVSVDPNTPTVLFVKLLKNEVLKPKLPTWDLMMKNIYSLGAYQVSRNNFNLQISRLDEDTGIENPVITQGPLKGRLWIQATRLDTLNQVGDAKPDGAFDFIDGLTIDPLNGRITFPLVEPFGRDLRGKLNSDPALINKYVYQPLYDSTRVIAQQLFPKLNRYILKGTYQSEVSSEFQLNAINVPPGSVQVSAGTLPLVEGADYTVDYNAGRVRILNQALLNSGQQLKIKMENNELFGLQQRSLFGSRFDYRVNHKLNLGGTIMNLTERPLTPKINIGEEAISNTIWGMDANYSSDSRWITKLVDKLPFLSTKEASSITFSGEFAKMVPGHPKALNFAGSSNGASYLDDFEGSRSIIDIKSPIGWQLSGTPQMFLESKEVNKLEYGFNRARLAFYNIDPIFFNRNNSLTPDNIKNNKTEQSNHYVREVIEQEVFPFKQSSTGQPLTLPTFDLAFYPTLRGPYNYTTNGVNADGTLNNPRNRWGGIFRRIESTDFEALNIEFIEMWVMDPFINKPNSTGGDLYFNLGSISEDILKDGRKSLENGLPGDGDISRTDSTAWGRIPKLQPVVQAFDNDPSARTFQDVGLDGLNNSSERQFFSTFLNLLNPQAAAQLQGDPSSDDFMYYRGGDLDNANAGILKRYEKYNGPDGNSKTNQQSQAALGIDNSASTSLPDGEDVNRDNNSSLADEYFQYKVSIKPGDLTVGQNYVTDKVTSNVKLPNGLTQPVSWYQLKIPLSDFTDKVGNIEDFKSIRFVRMFMTGFADTTILRMAKLQLVRGEWRRYNALNKPGSVIVDPTLNTSSPDESTIDVSTVNIEENGRRTPIPYVVPPGIDRERDFSNFRGDTRQNEQSLSLNIKKLRDGYGRAAFRTTYNDFRSYRKLEMFVHAEGADLRDNDVSAFIRIGTDNQDNYYEYEIPLKVTVPGSRDANAIWPDVNTISLELKRLQAAKAQRNAALSSGQITRTADPFYVKDGNSTITVVGQPDLSKVRVYMVGVKNPLNDNMEKSAEVWFNELRLTDFDERGGWAATARMNTKLADFGDITVSGSTSTIGFGSIDKKVSERNRSEDMFFDVSSSLELGKFFPSRSGIKVPLFINFSSQLSVPQFDPGSQDIELKEAMDKLSKSQRRELHQRVDDFTRRRGINFTNVRKIKTNPDSKSRIWDVENLSVNYAYTEYNHRDFITESALQKTYRAGLAYNYSGESKNYTPFSKFIKSNKLALLKDFNFSLLPSALNFRVDVDRLYSENTLRNNEGADNPLPITTNFNKNFQMSRLYGMSWDLTKSLKIDFNATNYSVIDEPEGRIEGAKRDSVWDNFKKLGRNTDYNHTLNLNYTVPISKIPGFGWTNLVARYGTNFNWRTEPLSTLNNKDINLGNTIQNARTLQINPTLNFATLYNKFGFVRKANDPKNKSASRYLVGILTSVKNVTGAYTRTEGTFLPGYLPGTKALGYDFDANAPGWDFLFGSQRDITGRAAANGWLSRDDRMNQPYTNNKKEDLNLRGTVEPFTDLRIELNASKSQSFNYSTNFKFNSTSQEFEYQSPITTGDFSISNVLLRTAFSKDDKDNNSKLFRQFEANRQTISRRLGALNPNSGGTNGGYADGYNKSSQDVIIASFMAAYSGKDAGKVNLGGFQKIPIPNWRITYNGLTKYDFFNKIFASFDVNHTYRSTYNINSFNSLARYQEANGYSSLKDVNGNFLPAYQFSQVTLAEQFLPLLGIDFRLKNSMTANFEYRKSRLLSLSLANSQLAQQRDNAIVFGFGYRTTNFRFPLGLFSGKKLNNDLNFKMDFALNDRKTVIYRADVEDPEVSSGAKNITLRPSIDYVLNQRFNLRLFYDNNITKPYTSQTFNTSFSNFGMSLRFTLQ
ncbi:MAG: cell surface protein SprA [Sphingobacteriaceae bacterium]|nr:cell surface protein SprA [Sphingobacteriaceae bacterium]